MLVRALSPFLIPGLSALFLAFFQVTKHHPLLRPINVFNDDPYDAVGSFGVQLAGLATLLALFWILFGNKRYQVQAETIALLAIVVTLCADAIALVRYPSVWLDQPGGTLLLLSVVLMALLTGALCWWHFIANPVNLEQRSLLTPLLISLGSIAILSVYPDSWHDGIIGGIGTALVGLVILFLVVWAWIRAFYLKQPGHYRWYLLLGVMVIGAGLGLGMGLREGVVEGFPQQVERILLVVSVFIGLEGTGVILGYVLLAAYLGLPPRWLR